MLEALFGEDPSTLRTIATSVGIIVALIAHGYLSRRQRLWPGLIVPVAYIAFVLTQPGIDSEVIGKGLIGGLTVLVVVWIMVNEDRTFRRDSARSRASGRDNDGEEGVQS